MGDCEYREEELRLATKAEVTAYLQAKADPRVLIPMEELLEALETYVAARIELSRVEDHKPELLEGQKQTCADTLAEFGSRLSRML